MYRNDGSRGRPSRNLVCGARGAGWFAAVVAVVGCSSDALTSNRTPPWRPVDPMTAGGGAAGVNGVTRTSDADDGQSAGAANGGTGGGDRSSASGGRSQSSGGADGGRNLDDGGAPPRPGTGGQRAGTGGASAGGATTTANEPTLPALPAACPELKTGSVTVMGQQVRLWVGEKGPGKRGPLLFYWHATGSDPEQAAVMLGPVLDDIQASGGMVASFSTTLGTGANYAIGVWYSDDFQMADVIVACAAAQLDIDTRRVYAAGCTSGGMQAGAMAFMRSSYLAGSMPDDGGVLPLPHITDLQDPAHVPAFAASYGPGTDIISFEETTRQACQASVDSGGFAIGCKYAAGHCSRPPEVLAAQWQFLKDHPFDTKTDPYAGGVPLSLPSACKVF
jgi:hypothetical protein